MIQRAEPMTPTQRNDASLPMIVIPFGGDLAINFLLVIEVVRHGCVSFRGRQIRVVTAHLIGGPAMSEIIHDNLRHPYSRNPLQASWLPLLLFDVRMA